MNLSFKFVILPTDALLWLVFLIIMGFVLFARGKMQLAAHWYQVFHRRPLTIIAAALLGVFLSISLLDSIHYRVMLPQNNNSDPNFYDAHISSVFDKIVSPLGTQTEKTYSSPLSSDPDLKNHYHILGTDKIGQDVFYVSLKSIRTGIVIGILTTLVMLPFALFLGLIAGYFQGLADDIIQYIYTTLSSIPGVLLIAASVLSMHIFIEKNPLAFPNIAERADLRLLSLCVILGITSWTTLCRLLRAEALKLREMDYVQAALSVGVRKTRIIFRHILPNVMHIIMIVIVLDFSSLVLAEAVLSYVGVGVAAETFSWGNMINSARLELAREPVVWWPLTAAFLLMFILVLSANIFADAVRDAFDPRLRKRR
ncbi:MAG: ABC-type dipeptide/oligopeptide/nickel transporter, permease component [Gammaproteobacteria bacterium]|jgi:ABC-type dipeptide/oligopeptide/nickel transport system permease subunit|nr:ABC-type dipeptide/oligopeptide/nickel transporter, permease component [Gammaproteobacteria bacterium]